MDILIYSNVKNLIPVESQPEIKRPPKNFPQIYLLIFLNFSTDDSVDVPLNHQTSIVWAEDKIIFLHGYFNIF